MRVERPLLLLLPLDFGLTQTAVIIIPLVGGFSIFTDDLIKLFSSLLFSSILFFNFQSRIKNCTFIFGQLPIHVFAQTSIALFVVFVVTFALILFM